MTTKRKPTPGQAIAYHNPCNGGLYHGILVKLGKNKK
jgi:hypothetical protein